MLPKALPAICLAILSGCSSPYQAGVILPDGRSFPGLQDLVSNGADAIAIHGMCTHDRDWVITSGRRMSEQLELDYRAPDTFWREFDGAQVWKNELLDDRGDIKLTSYAIVWSPPPYFSIA